MVYDLREFLITSTGWRQEDVDEFLGEEVVGMIIPGRVRAESAKAMAPPGITAAVRPKRSCAMCTRFVNYDEGCLLDGKSYVTTPTMVCPRWSGVDMDMDHPMEGRQ